MHAGDTLSRAAVSVRGKVQEIGKTPLLRLFEKNPYMNEIYPSEESRQALTVFHLYEGSGEWFDLSKKPIERASFTIGSKQNRKKNRAMKLRKNVTAAGLVKLSARKIASIFRSCLL